MVAGGPASYFYWATAARFSCGLGGSVWLRWCVDLEPKGALILAVEFKLILLKCMVPRGSFFF